MIEPKLFHDCFLQHHFQFIIHYDPSIRCCIAWVNEKCIKWNMKQISRPHWCFM
jgi:hypothetical protein